jgi:hypothetical protein
MDINKLKNVIDANIDLKKMIFFHYIRDHIHELLYDNQVLEIDNNKSSINFLNYKSYTLSHEKPIEESIDEFEMLMPKFKKYSIEINEILNNNIEDFKSHLCEFQKILKEKYFHYNNIEFLLSKDNYNKQELTLRIFIEDKTYNIQIPIKNFWYYIQDNYDNNIETIIKNRLIEIILKQLNEFEGMSDYKVLISENQIQTIKVTEVRYSRTQISFPVRILSNKQLYNEAIYELTNYLQREKYQKYLNKFYNKYEFITSGKLESDYDLESGKMHPSFDLNKFDNIEKLYNDIKKYENECEKLKNISDESLMHDYKFMNKLFINKIDFKEINGDKYSVYKYSCDKRKNIMFFKNGIKVSRTKYHEVALLIGYNKTITIDDRAVNDWDALSRKQLSEKQIDKYKDKLNWKYISKYHKLTDDMLIKYHNYINWEIVLKERKIKRTILEKLAPLIGWGVISEFAKMNEPFLMDHLYDLDIEKVLKNPCCKFAHDIINILVKTSKNF